MEVRPGYKSAEVGIIPDDWRVALLPEVCRFRAGKAHEQHISDTGRYICVNSKFISSDGTVRKYSTDNLCPAKKGDVLMVMSDLPNGRALAKAYLVDADDTYAVNQRVCALTAYRDLPPYLFYVLNRNSYFLAFDDGVNQTHLLNPVFHKCPLALPPTIEEQRAIATALSDVDALLGGLNRLIAKKRDIKQAAMQQLLTGQTRLPGFHGQWEMKTVADVADVTKGTQLHSGETNDEGQFPHFNGGISPSNYTDKANTAADTIAISEGGNSCGYVQLVRERFWCGGHCYALVPEGADNRFLYHALKGQQAAIMRLRVGSGLPNVQKTALESFKVSLPSDPSEQTAIGATLSDIDAELIALEARRDKTRDLKQAMMQELLTGKTRLVPVGAAHA